MRTETRTVSPKVATERVAKWVAKQTVDGTIKWIGTPDGGDFGDGDYADVIVVYGKQAVERWTGHAAGSTKAIVICEGAYDYEWATIGASNAEYHGKVKIPGYFTEAYNHYAVSVVDNRY